MAEVAAIASVMGIVSLVIQVGESLIKLKSIWNGVKEAPEEVTHLIEELELVGLVLSEINTIQNADRDLSYIAPRALNKCLIFCQKGAGLLETIVKDLDVEIKKRSLFGGLKIVLKTDTINKLKERLRSAQLVLIFSHQIYSDAAQKGRHELQLHRAELQYQELVVIRKSLPWSTNEAAIHSPEPHLACHDEQRLVNKVPVNSKLRFLQRQRRFVARLKPPAWVSCLKHALDIYGYQSQAGWMFTFCAYNIIPVQAPILRCVKEGDIAGVQKLLAERKASPFDRSVAGFTILDVAAQFHQLEICRLLISEGADPNVSAYDSFVQAPCIPNLFTKAVKARANGNFFELVRCLTVGTDYEVFVQENSIIDHGIYEILTWLMEQYTFDRASIPENKRWTIELSIAKLSFQPNMASLVISAMKTQKIRIGEMVRSKPRHGRFLLQCAAQNLGEHCAASYFSTHQVSERKNHAIISSETTKPRQNRWIASERVALLSLIMNLACVVARSELHWLNFFHRTPLLSIFCWFVQFPNPYEPKDLFCRIVTTTPTADMKELASSLLAPMRMWLEQLKSAGVDLEEYGRIEHGIHVQLPENVAKNCFYVWHKKRGSQIRRYCTMCRLVSFSYGPSSNDWQFWLTEWVDDSFIEFWEMVEHPERAMPGAWIEEQNHPNLCDLPASIDISQRECFDRHSNMFN